MIKSEGWHTARRLWACGSCGIVIKRHRKYKQIKGKLGARAWEYKFCEQCATIMEDMHLRETMRGMGYNVAR